MIKARFENNGKRVDVLGLSEENIKRLMKDKPIQFDGSEIGLDGEVVIVYGRTEEVIANKLGIPIQNQKVEI